jgi:hypothetical protein
MTWDGPPCGAIRCASRQNGRSTLQWHNRVAVRSMGILTEWAMARGESPQLQTFREDFTTYLWDTTL